MSSRATEELSLPYKWPLIVGGVGIVSILVVLAVVDQVRLSRKLADLQLRFCSLTIPDPQLRDIDYLAESGNNSERRVGDLLIRTLNALTTEGRIQVFYPVGNEVWSASSWSGGAPVSSSQFPEGYHTWKELSTADCAGVIEARQLRVVRSASTPAGRRAVLVLTVSKGGGLVY